MRMFMFPPVNMLAARIMGFLQKNPWQVPSRFYDVVFVESEFSRKMLEDSNYDLRKVVVAGKPLLDSVGERLYDPEHFREMCRNLGLGEECGFVLVNVEPAAEHHYASWERHWQLFDTVMRSLERVNRKVVLSLHPLCDYENYRFVEQKFGYRISRQYKIMELYPYCDFVVSFACSTNTLALIFKKRLVIYDWFGMTAESAPRGHLFRIPGALYAYTGSELSARIDEVVKQHSPHRREDLGDLRLQACANIYNYVCGKFAYRGKNRGVR